MKKIGIIGGLSWKSTIEYYRIINQSINQKLGGLHSAKMVIESYDFDEVNNLQKQGEWDEIAKILIKSANNLVQNEAEIILIATNTLHKLVPGIQKEISVPIFHIADATAKEILKQGYKKVLLLGTKYTMQEDFYKAKLENQYNIEVMVPNVVGQNVVHDIIFNELCKGIISDESREMILFIIDNCKKFGAEAVILGCTELPNLIKNSSLPILNTAEIHSKGAVEYVLSESREEAKV